MATLTLPDLPDDLLSRLEAAARRHGRTVDDEVRLLLERRYARRDLMLERIRTRWNTVAVPRAAEVDAWIENARC